MFKEFYTKMIIPITQLTDTQLHEFIKVIASFIVIVTIAITIFFVAEGLTNVVDGIFMSLFISVLLLFNFFWGICFMDNIWKGFFGIALSLIYLLIHGITINAYKKYKDRRKQHE